MPRRSAIASRSKPSIGEGNTHLCLARPFGLDLPAGGLLKLLRPDVNPIDDHASSLGRPLCPGNAPADRPSASITTKIRNKKGPDTIPISPPSLARDARSRVSGRPFGRLALDARPGVLPALGRRRPEAATRLGKIGAQVQGREGLGNRFASPQPTSSSLRPRDSRARRTRELQYRPCVDTTSLNLDSEDSEFSRTTAGGRVEAATIEETPAASYSLKNR